MSVIPRFSGEYQLRYSDGGLSQPDYAWYRDSARTLESLGIRRSVGRTGICYDNSMAESFFANLKNERVHRTVYPTRQHAIDDIARYIELRYNTQRLHSGLGYKTPHEVYTEY
jgi:transposase InsO family protein